MSLTFPVLLPQAWCSGGGANQGLLNTLGTITNNVLSSPANQPSASLADGFPIDNMSAGGYSPNGGDMNAALYYITLFQAWVNAGQMFPFNSTLATDLGGYPIGTTLMLGTGTQAVMSTASSNSTNPNSSMTGWQYTYGQVVGTGASVTPATGTAGSMYYNSTDGLMLQARSGSAMDLAVANPSGSSVIFYVPTGTLNTIFNGTVTAPVLQTGATASAGGPGSMSFSGVYGLALQARSGSAYDFVISTPGGSGAIMAVPTGTANSTFFGTVTAPVLQTGASTAGSAGTVFYNSVSGLTIWGKTGATYDLVLNGASATVMAVPTGTVNTIFNGTVTAPVLQTGASTAGSAGAVSYNSVNGLTIWGKTGATYDLVLNGASANVMLVPTGTTNTIWPGKQTWTPLANASPSLGDVWMDSTQQTLCAEEGAGGNPVKIYKSGTLATMKAVGGYSVMCTTAGAFTYDFLPASSLINTTALPANFWVVGKVLRVELFGYFTTGSSVSSIGFALYQGALSITSVNSSSLLATTSYNFKTTITLTCTSLGGVGTATALACQEILFSGSGGAVLTADVVSGFQTTAAAAIDVKGGFSANSSIVVSFLSAIVSVLS